MAGCGWAIGMGTRGRTMESTDKAIGLLAAELGSVFLLTTEDSFSIRTSQGSLHT